MAVSRSTAKVLTGDYKGNGPFSVSLTIPAGAVGVIVVTSEHAQLGTDTSMTANLTVKDGSSRAWMKRAFSCLRDGGMGYYSGVWVYDWYNGTGSSVSVIVSIDVSAIAWNPMMSYGAQVLTGVKDPSSYTPAVTTTYAHQLPQVSVRPTSVGSQLVGGIVMKLNGTSTEAKGSFSAISGSTIDSSMQLSNTAMLSAMVARSSTETTVGEFVTIGASAPAQPATDSFYSLAIVEYLAAGAMGGAETLPKRGAAANKIAFIGDSLTYQSVDGVPTGETNVTAALKNVGWPSAGIWWYGVGGKQIAAPEAGSGKTTMQNISEARTALGGEPDLWVIALVTNDLGSDDATITAAMQSVFNALGSSAKVAWVNAGLSSLSTTNEVRANNVLRTMIANRPNSYLIDWWEYAAQHDDPASWYVDGTHMTASGYIVKNAYMADQTLEAMYRLGVTTTTPPASGGAAAVIARSTPVAADGGYKSNSPYVVSFDVPAGAVGVLVCGAENAFDEATGALVSLAVTDGARTWTLRGKTAIDGGGVQFAGTWVYDWYNASAATVTCTVSVDFSAIAYNPMVSIVPQVLTNVKDPSAYTPKTAIANNGTSSQVSITPTAVGSQIIAGVTRRIMDGETATIASVIPVSGCFVDNGPSAHYMTASYLGAVVARAQPESSTSAAVAVGASGPSGKGYTVLAVEYLPSTTSVAGETHYRVRVGGTWQMAQNLTRIANAWVPTIHYGIYRVPDTTAPSKPTVTVDATNQTKLIATFSATDNIAVTKYDIQIDSAAWVTDVTSPYTFSNLVANSTHTITVRAYDAAGNSTISSWTGATAASTATAPDGRVYTATVIADTPAVYYAMQEQSGTVAVDWSGNKKDATYLGGAKVDWSGNRYKFPAVALGRCVRTENVSTNTQAVQVPANAVDVTKGITLEAWVRVEGLGWNSHLFSLSDASGGDDIGLQVSDSNLTLVVGGVSVSGAALSQNVWHHVVATVTTAKVGTIYVDGTQIATGTVGALVQQSRPSISIGRAVGNSNYISGMWTQCAIYNSVLTSAKISSHYATGLSDQDPVWHGGNEWYDPSYFTQWKGAQWLNDTSRIFVADWMPSYGLLTSIASGKPYYNVGINHHYWSTEDGSAYTDTVARFAQETVNNDMRMIPDWGKIGTSYDGQDVIGFAGPDEADMHNPDDPNDSGNLTVLREALAKTKVAGRMGYENNGTLVTTGQGSPSVPPETYANLDGLALWTADLYFYSVGNQTYGDLATYWGLKRDQCRRACNYGTLIERQRGMLLTPKPIWGIIDLAHPNNTNDAGGPNPNQVEGAVWGSIIGGARGIEWFHHSFVSPSGLPPNWSASVDYAVSANVMYNGTPYYAALKPAVGEVPSPSSYTWVRYSTNSGAGIDIAEARHPDLPARIIKIRADLDRIAAAIYSPTTPHLCHKNIYSTYRPNARDGKKYIIAIPDLGAPNGGTFNMYLPKGQNPTSIEVVGEGRTITPSDGNFTDTFAAEYTHHVYRW